MKKLSFYACLLVLALLFSACEKEETSTVIPEPEASMTRTFDFRNADENDKAIYTLGILETQLVLENDKLEIVFAPSRPAGKDALVFKIDKAAITNGYVGKYKVKSLPDTEIGLADITYYHYLSSGSGSALFSGGNAIVGELEITSFDAKHKLASGKYQVDIKDAFDPTRPSTNLADAIKCDITVKGEFRNLKLVVL